MTYSTETRGTEIGDESVNRLAQMAVAAWQQQQGSAQTGQATTGRADQPTVTQQSSIEDQTRLFGALAQFAAQHLIPAGVNALQQLLGNQRSAYGVQTRDIEEDQRGIFDFVKKALPGILDTAADLAQNFLRPRGRALDDTETRFAFLAPLLIPLVSAAASGVTAALAGRRGPLDVNNEEDSRLLSGFFTTTFQNCFRPPILAELNKVIATGRGTPVTPRPGSQQQSPGQTW